jgi:cold shock CspA family protein
MCRIDPIRASPLASTRQYNLGELGMRELGELVEWNDARGFGFIEVKGSGERIFVHVTAFSRLRTRPQTGETVSFSIEPGPEGKPRAVRVSRPGDFQETARMPRRSTGDAAAAHREPSDGSFVRRILGFAAAAVAVFAFMDWLAEREGVPVVDSLRSAEPRSASSVSPFVPPQPRFQCDGRTRCPQMRSCDEATFFLLNCPGTQMDGDGDGVPCEDQWCS